MSILLLKIISVVSLSGCEKLFGFDNLTGYDKKRLYAFLAERYLSFWFHKYARPIAWHWTFYDIEKEES